MTRKIALATLLLPLVAVVGCAQMQADQRIKEYHTMIDPMLGVASKDDVATQFGMPTKRAELGTMETWEYYKTLGTRSVGNAYNPYGYSWSTQVQSHEMYDDLTLYFNQSGILINWRASVQR